MASTMSVSGIVSGMDWESMIDELITKAAKPAQVQVSKRTNLQNKKSLFEEMKVMVQSIQSSLSSMKLPSTYKAKEVDIERIDTNGSYKGVLTASVNADAEVNVYDLKVNRLATAQTNRSTQITTSTIASALGSIESGTMYINIGGKKVGVEVEATDSLQTLKSKINTVLKTQDTPLNVTASVVDSKLILKSDNTGLGTASNSETFTYGYNGHNTLTTMNVSAADLEAGNFVIRDSKSKQYTYGEDYVLVNGTDIRWKQYEQSDQISLNESIDVTYTMAAGDVYSITASVGKDAELPFDVIDNGTLASRLKLYDTDGNVLTDANGNEYEYGKDFELVDGKLTWTPSTYTPSTREPDTYTVSYSKETPISSSLTTTRGHAYTFDYVSQELLPSAAQSIYISNANDTEYDTYVLFDNFENISGTSIMKGAVDQNGNLHDVLVFDDPTQMKLTGSDGTVYTYGEDYVLCTDTDYGENAVIVWHNDDNFYNPYSSDGTSSSTTAQPIAGTLTLSYKPERTYDSTSSDSISEALQSYYINNGNSYDGLKLTASDGETTYTYGTDFDITGGKIKWNSSTSDDDVSDDVITELTDIYNTAYDLTEGTELPTITLTNSKGVLRTYIDPEDRSLFTLTDTNGKSYEYGKDYVLRVNDEGNGYVISWALTDSSSITDANTVVTTYMQHKGLSTYGMKQAPSESTNYTFEFTSKTTEEAKVTVTKGSNDTEALSELLGIDDIDYDYLSITDSSGKDIDASYYTIDDDGYINWARTSTILTEEPSSYTISYPVSSLAMESNGSNLQELDYYADDGWGNDDGFAALYGVNSIFNSYTIDETTYYVVDDLSFSEQYISLTDSDGNKYTYGEDFVLVNYDNGDDDDGMYIAWSSSPIAQAYAADKGLTASNLTPDAGQEYTLALNMYYSSSSSNDEDFDAIIAAALEDADSDDYESYLSEIVITGSDGTEYIYGTDYTIEYDEDEGPYISWILGEDTNAPDDGTEYVLKYTSYAGSTSAITEDDDGNYIVHITGDSGSDLTYSQLMIDPRINSKSAALADYLTLSDGTDTYTYGTDYKLKRGNGNTITLEWLDDDTEPADITSLSLTFAAGGETYEIKDAVTRSSTDYVNPNSITDYPSYSEFSNGSSTITQGVKTFYEGIDYEIVQDADNSERAAVKWLSDEDGGYEWYMPSPGSSYTLNLTTSSGSTKSYTAYRSMRDTLNMANLDGNGNGFTTATGSITVNYGDLRINPEDSEVTLTETDDDGNTTSTTMTGNQALKQKYSFNVSRGTHGGVDTTFDFRWLAPTTTTRTDLPEYGDEITAEYEYDANTFTLSDDLDGELVKALGLLDDVTEAQDAELDLDGEIVTRSSNYIGPDYDNELIKGMTIQLKGVGEVSLDVSHNLEKAVESINTFVTSYNDLMSWMNTRMTEKEVDKDTAATIDSDDFRMRWGLLHGNSLLRNTKSQMRNLMAQTFTYSFTKRTSENEIYGTMSNNGLKAESTLRLRIGSKYADVSILPTDTIEDIAAKINDSENTSMRSMFYGDDGKLLEQPLLKASVTDDRLVISSTNDDAITMSGTAAMKALGMNYTYTGLFQLGISTTSTDYGKSGELEFDDSAFMEAMEDNPDEAQELMLMFVSEMDTWLKSMLTTSASGETSGTLTRQIEDLETQIESIDDYLETYQDRLDRQEEALRTRYANAETQFYKLSQQANSIAAILNQLNGYTSSSSSDS